MKTLIFIAFSTCIAFSGCNNDAAVKLSQNELTQSNTEIPKKKVEEQFSSSAGKTVLEDEQVKEVASKTTQEVVEESKQVLAKKSKQLKEIDKPEIAKEDKATFVKKVSPQTPSVAKKRTAEIEFEDQFYDFGEIMQGDKIDHKFSFTNTGKAPLSITEADATCGCATPSIPFMDIMPGEVGYIGVRYNSVGKEGEETPEVTIYSNAGKHPIMVLKLKGYVKTPEEVKAEQLAKKDSLIQEAKDSTKVDIEK